MKKHIRNVIVGLDLGDKINRVCVIGNACGNILEKRDVKNTTVSIRKYFSQFEGVTVAMEAGTHSPWVSHLLDEMGIKVLIGNPGKLRAIYGSDRKTDDRDAIMLARIARFDPELLYPITHRSEDAHNDLAIIKARDILVKARAQLVNFVRSSFKRLGLRVSTCSVTAFPGRAFEELPEVLAPALCPIIDQIQALTDKIKQYDRQIEMLCDVKYPETVSVRQIKGVGFLTALAFVLTLENPDRFKKSRDVGPYLGLTPRRDQSGQIDKQLRITKAGNGYLRRLLVSSAQYIMGPFGEECDLMNLGMRLCQRGGKNAKRRAVVAVARKLSVLMHALWSTGEVYEPLRNAKTKASV